MKDAVRQYANGAGKPQTLPLLMAQNNFWGRRFISGPHLISRNEAEQFYCRYKWAFRKKFTAQSEYYAFDEVEEFIYGEIRRLKSYGLEELIRNPPRMEIIWKKKEKTAIKRGLLEPWPW